jgi:hypothetical protein
MNINKKTNIKNEEHKKGIEHGHRPASRTGQPGQDSQDRTSSKEDSPNMIARTGQPKQGRQTGTGRTGKAE